MTASYLPKKIVSRASQRAALLGVLVALLSAAAAAERIRVEPQIGPHEPRRVEFHPADPFLLLIVEGDGRVSLWDVGGPDHPIPMT